MRYNKFNAAVYELTEFLFRFWPALRKNTYVTWAGLTAEMTGQILRAQLLMKEVDGQIEELHECWDTQEAEDFYPGFREIYFLRIIATNH